MAASDQTLRYGIIGTGMMGCEHIRNIVAIEGAEVTAIADPDERSRGFGYLSAGEDPELEIYQDYRELLERAPVDAVVVASPNHTHAQVLADVFQTRKHVLIEKPMCTTVEDCRAVVEGAQSHPGLVWVGLEYRYMAPVARFLREISSGRVGEIKMLAIREHRFPFLPKVGNWNRFNRNTGGTLVEKCCHFFDLMNLVAGSMPVRVYASGAQDVNHLDERYEGESPDILDNAFTIVDYQSGCRACLDLCMFAESSRNEQELVATGTGGKLECFIPQGTIVVGTRKYKEFETFEVGPDERVSYAGFHHGASYLEHLDFLAAIRGGLPPKVSVADGLLSVAVGAAAHLSIDERRPVDLAEFGLG
jgi:myo-inositol 2-dehydrogenase/D-chiro-inositol 1-dehydrogenase